MAGVDHVAIFEQSPNPYAVVDRELRCVAANPAFRWVFLRSRQELVGASLMTVFAEDSEEQRARLRAAIDDVFRTGQVAVVAAVQGHGLGLLGEAAHRAWGATYVPVLDATGRVAFVLWHHGPIVREASVREVVERERGELIDARRAAHGQIERARALIECAALQQRELRRLRSSLEGTMAGLHTSGRTPAAWQGALADVHCDARRMLMTMTTLGDAIDIITGAHTIDIELIDMAEVVRAAADRARPEAARKGVALTVAIEAPAAVRGCASQLQRIVEELLAFAIDHTQSSRRVILRMATRGGEIEIAVTSSHEDLGAAEPGLFARLVPFDGGTLPWLDGRVARYIVEAHGGEVEAVRGAAGRGVTLTVRLPASGEQPALTGLRVSTSQRFVPGALEGLRVLVVGDEADVCASVRVPLERCQAQVTCAATVPEALLRMPQIKQLRPDVVLDVRRSDDRAELARRIGALPDDHGGLTPVMALRPDEPVRGAARALRHRGKPVETVQWLELVAEVASSRSATNERHDHRSRERAEPAAGVDYAAVFEAAPDPYAVIDRELRYAAVNAAYCRVIGRRPDQLIGTDVLAQLGDALEQDLARQLRVVIEHVFAEGDPADLPALPYRPFPIVELPFRRAWRDWRASHSPLFGADHRVELVLQHEAPISRHPIRQELVRAERTERIELEKTVHREAGRALTLADVSGGIRSSVLSAASTLLSPLDDPTREIVAPADRLDQLARGTRYLDEVVGDAMDTIRVIVGRGPFDDRAVDLGGVVRDAAALAQRTAKAVAIDVAIAEPAVVAGDVALLSRMVRGLLWSAIAPAPPGARVVMQVAARRDDVEIAMHGIGVDLGAERLPHLFQPIHLFDSCIATGSVIGRLTQYIVEAHGGELTATSDGVVVRLPRSRAD